MSAGRIKKHKTPESVPNVGDPDRKRVLNVLAQRRYRQRQREKIASLKAQAQANSPVRARSIHRHDEELFGADNSIEPFLVSNTTEIDATEDLCMLPDDSLSIFPLDDNTSFELNLATGFNDFSSLPTPLPSSPCSSSSPPNLNFPISPDGAIISLPILNALYAFGRVATALDIISHLWDPSHLHVLPKSIPALALLPTNLHPTPAQYTIPHHPVLDLLPWPTVREKLICILSLPSPLRPPVAREDVTDHSSTSSPTATTSAQSSALGGAEMKQSGAIVQLIQDLDDLQDGCGLRVHGNTTTWDQGNELVEEAWEIGSVFYSKWWWCLDQKIIETSNQKRRERGLDRLKLTA